MNEEIVARFSADLGPIESGLRSLKTRISEWSTEVKAKVKEAFSMLAIPFTLGGAFEVLRRASEDIVRIKREAETLRISTDFVQSLESIGRSSGISADSIESLMDKFVKGLPAGSDVEQSFYQIADKIAGIEDPANRARVAVEAFGKSGLQMIPILSQGSAKIKELGASFAKFSSDDMAHIEHARRNIDDLGHTLEVFFAKQANKQRIPILSQMLYPGQGNDDARIIDMEERLKTKIGAREARTEAVKQEAEAQKALVDAALLQVDLAKQKADMKTKDLAGQIAELEVQKESALESYVTTDNEVEALGYLKESYDLDEKILDLKKQQNEERERAREIQRHINLLNAQAEQRRLAPYQPSLQDVAKFRGPMGDKARSVEDLTQQAKDAYAQGNKARGDALVNQIEGYDVKVGKLSPYDQRRKDEAAAYLKRTGVNVSPELFDHHVAGLRDSLPMLQKTESQQIQGEIKTQTTKLEEILTRAGIKVSDIGPMGGS